MCRHIALFLFGTKISTINKFSIAHKRDLLSYLILWLN